MRLSPIPVNDAERVASLHTLGILDAPVEERFDSITRLAQTIFSVPIAAISLIDASRLWFKSSIGINIPEIPREISFCSHTILSDDTLIIPNTNADERFADNPLVTGFPHAAFYAGQPLLDELGFRLGTICIFDTKPRDLSSREISILRELGLMTQCQLLTANTAKQQNKRQQALLSISESLMDALMVTDKNGKIQYTNKSIETIFGYSQSECSERNFDEFFYTPEATKILHNFHDTNSNHGEDSLYELTAKNRDNRLFPVKISTIHTKGFGNEVYVHTIRDISQEKKGNVFFHHD